MVDRTLSGSPDEITTRPVSPRGGAAGSLVDAGLHSAAGLDHPAQLVAQAARAAEIDLEILAAFTSFTPLIDDHEITVPANHGTSIYSGPRAAVAARHSTKVPGRSVVP